MESRLWVLVGLSVKSTASASILRAPDATGHFKRMRRHVTGVGNHAPSSIWREIGDDVLLVVNGQRGIGGRSTATSGSSGGFCMGVLATLSIPPTLLGAPRHIDDGGSRQHQREDNRRAVSCAWHRYGTVGHIGS